MALGLHMTPAIGDFKEGTWMTSLLRIEEHNDDVPISTRESRSNWELSTARAATVIRFLIERVEFDPCLQSAAGFGEFHPRVANDSSVNRARNRRVDIVILEASS